MKTYKLQAAIELVARYGFSSLSIREGAREANPLVTLHQSFMPQGEEYVTIRKARGKWKGDSIGSAWRR